MSAVIFKMVWAALFFYMAGELYEDDELVVQVEQGLLRGEVLESAAGGTYYSFKGIPYAEPPVGQLRFKDAEPPLSWEGVRNATEHGNACSQMVPISDEDCLFLNVYTPQLPQNQSSKLPVMFWIHGGGFVYGSGDADGFGPDYLVAANVVLVTINYRLGPLGFLYLGNVAPSNVGMKDQIAALRWIQRNIAAFGGDSGKVTIFGESAGSAAVSLLMLSPMTKGLFHGAIAQSGHGMNKCGNSTALLEMSLRLADAVDCAADTRAAILECLRGIDASLLVNASVQIVDGDSVMECSFWPIVDKEVPEFLPESSTELIKKGLVHPVPFVLGFNNKEANVILAQYNFYDENVAQKFDSSWDSKITPAIRIEVNVSTGREILQTLRDFYMDGKSITNETVPGLLDMLTDLAIGEGYYFTLKCMARNSKVRLFQYIFSIDDELNFGKLIIPHGLNITGASHTDEIGYLFREKVLPEVTSNSSAALARARMVRLWTNFAKFGVPTVNSDPLLETSWKPYTSDEKNYLEIGATLRAGKDLYSDRVEFWEELHKKYSPAA